MTEQRFDMVVFGVSLAGAALLVPFLRSWWFDVLLHDRIFSAWLFWRDVGRTMRRALAAFLASPAVAVLALGALAFVWLGPAPGRDTSFVLIVFVLPITYVSTLLFGLPLYFLFKQHGWLSWWHSLVGGLLCALPCAAFLLRVNPSSYSVQVLFTSCFAVGALVGVVFWALAGRSHAP